MSNEVQTIRPADLSYIHHALQTLDAGVDRVASQVADVGGEVSQVRAELQDLAAQFAAFVAADLQAKELARAQARQIRLRQELDKKFGHHDEVRRHVTGILQAADLRIVRQDTVATATESLMLSAPRYWLAPALVALAAWLRDDKALAERAVAEAIRRDDEKTSLFFALIGRRAGRPGVTRVWLDRFLGQQDPSKLDRQTVVLVDALANGVFGPEVRGECARRVESWVAELADRAGFVDEQRANWRAALQSKTPSTDNTKRYPHLVKHSPTWQALDGALDAAKLHGVVHEYLRSIFDGALTPSANLKAAVDGLLDTLVQNFDDEELPLRREDRLCELIIEEEGDKDAAERRNDLDREVLAERVSFTQLLTNAAMHPEASNVSRATQRFAVALSREWIKDAHEDLTATARAAVPLEIAIEIDGWKGQTRKGENEAELLQSLAAHIDERERAEVKGTRFGAFESFLLGLPAAALVYGLAAGNNVATAIGGALFAWLGWSVLSKVQSRKPIRARYAKLRADAPRILKAVLAEALEWRRDHARRDAAAAAVTELLDGIRADQHVLSSHDTARSVMQEATA